MHLPCTCDVVLFYAGERVWRAAAQREAVLAASKPALERLETERRLFVRGRTLALAQVRVVLASLHVSLSKECV